MRIHTYTYTYKHTKIIYIKHKSYAGCADWFGNYVFKLIINLVAAIYGGGTKTLLATGNTIKMWKLCNNCIVIAFKVCGWFLMSQINS